MSFCRVLQPGALTTVQDGGRYGFQQFGIGPGGVMDRQAYIMGNWLVGNNAGNNTGAAVLEATVIGPHLEFLHSGVIALTGADMQATLNGEKIRRYAAIEVAAGDVLRLSAAVNGCRAYIAFAGGIDVPLVMNSRSTNLKCAFGGFNGRKLAAGDELDVCPTENPADYMAARGRSMAEQVYPTEFTLRFVPGPQQDMFTEESRRIFEQSEYIVSAKSDRMGYRLEGPTLSAVGGMDIVSDGIAAGSIQVSTDGQPIVLMADRQTTGGYAKIGTVVSYDLWLLAQAMPGAKVYFLAVTVEEAQRLLRS